MLKRIKRALAWARAVRASRNGDLELAFNHLRRVKALAPLRFYERAFEGGLLLRMHRFSEADRILLSVQKDTSDGSTPDRRDTNLFCSFSLSYNDKQRANILAEAAAVPCAPAIRRLLPLWKNRDDIRY